VLKPQRSGFYETPLSVLLASLEISRLIVTGFTTDICVLFTAHDAYMRGFDVLVPSDCTAAVEGEFHDSALKLMERVANVDTGSSDAIDLTPNALKKKGARS
jgi:nicotinamidase-related amidase